MIWIDIQNSVELFHQLSDLGVHLAWILVAIYAWIVLRDIRKNLKDD